MDRRDSLRSILLGSVAGGLALHGCQPGDSELGEALQSRAEEHYFGRTPKELEEIEKLQAEQFFNEHEMETISVLSDLILPPNEQSGGAVDAGVPGFVEFMAKDIPELQTTFRGGLMWLDHKSNTEYGAEFKALEEANQKEILDAIAWYDPELSLDEQPLEIQFFALVRNLTVCGYYTSKIGIEDLGYKGNMPNVWDGVPQHVLDKHGMAYEEEWISRCVDQSKRGVIAEWDEEGNLLT